MTAKPTPSSPLPDDDDHPEWTAEEVARAKPFAELFPLHAAAIRKGRGKQKTPTKERVTLRLDRETLNAFKATGAGWQTRIDEALRKARP